MEVYLFIPQSLSPAVCQCLCWGLRTQKRSSSWSPGSFPHRGGQGQTSICPAAGLCDLGCTPPSLGSSSFLSKAVSSIPSPGVTVEFPTWCPQGGKFSVDAGCCDCDFLLSLLSVPDTCILPMCFSVTLRGRIIAGEDEAERRHAQGHTSRKWTCTQLCLPISHCTPSCHLPPLPGEGRPTLAGQPRAHWVDLAPQGPPGCPAPMMDGSGGYLLPERLPRPRP